MAVGGDRSALAAATTWLKCLAGWSEFSPGPRNLPLGKKEQQALDAETADAETGWHGLVH